MKGRKIDRREFIRLSAMTAVGAAAAACGALRRQPPRRCGQLLCRRPRCRRPPYRQPRAGRCRGADRCVPPTAVATDRRASRQV